MKHGPTVDLTSLPPAILAPRPINITQAVGSSSISSAWPGADIYMLKFSAILASLLPIVGRSYLYGCSRTGPDRQGP